jgi:hypothetical protein
VAYSPILDASIKNGERGLARTHWTAVHLDLPVSHLESAMQRCLAAGATSRTAITVHSFGRRRPPRSVRAMEMRRNAPGAPLTHRKRLESVIAAG